MSVLLWTFSPLAAARVSNRLARAANRIRNSNSIERAIGCTEKTRIPVTDAELKSRYQASEMLERARRAVRYNLPPIGPIEVERAFANDAKRAHLFDKNGRRK